MPPGLKLNAVAFVSPQNHPILIRTFNKQDEHEIKYHYITHTSLDVVDERGAYHVSQVLAQSLILTILSLCGREESRMLSRSTIYYGRCCCVWVYHTPQGQNYFGLGSIRCSREGCRDNDGRVDISQLFFKTDAVLDIQSFPYGILLLGIEPFSQA